MPAQPPRTDIDKDDRPVGRTYLGLFELSTEWTWLETVAVRPSRGQDYVATAIQRIVIGGSTTRDTIPRGPSMPPAPLDNSSL